MEADGFQADTEDDDEDDCVIISTQSGKLHRKIFFFVKLYLLTVIFNFKV